MTDTANYVVGFYYLTQLHSNCRLTPTNDKRPFIELPETIDHHRMRFLSK